METDNSLTAVRLLAEGKADVALLDTRLPGLSDPNLLRELQQAAKSTPVLWVHEKGDGLPPEPVPKADVEARHARQLEAIGRLAAAVAHELNNMLTVIMGHNEIGLEQLDPGLAPRNHFQIVHKVASQAAVLTGQLLAFSRKPLPEPVLLDLNALAADMTPMLRRLVQNNVRLAVVPEPTLGPIKADPAQVEQVLTNLVLNARDAMPQGGEVVVATANVELEESSPGLRVPVPPGPYVMLTVRDSGQGMAEETLTRVFEPFFTTKPRGKGTGLGLSIVWEIVQACGGSLRVMSQPGQGAAFSVFFPRAQATKTGTETRPG